MKNKPLVSVIITAYNASAYLSEALQSVVNQTYKNLEVIVVDDGSSDTTYSIARQFAKDDKRVKVYKLRSNKGPSVASNAGMKKARGTFIARMDADDVMMINRIEKQVMFLQRHTDILMVGGQCNLINEKSEVIGQKKYPTAHTAIYNALFTMNPIQHPACMFRRDIMVKESISYHNHSLLAHDLELIFELSQYGKLANLADTVLSYRQHYDSLSLKNPKETFKATLYVRSKAVREYGYTPTLKAQFINMCQIIAVFLLPNRLIYALFEFLRVRKKSSMRNNIFLPFQRYAYKLAYSFNVLL